MVGYGGGVPRLNGHQKAPQLDLIKAKFLDEPSLLDEMEGQHGQSVARRCLSKGKDIKLPVALCILHTLIT